MGFVSGALQWAYSTQRHWDETILCVGIIFELWPATVDRIQSGAEESMFCARAVIAMKRSFHHFAISPSFRSHSAGRLTEW